MDNKMMSVFLLGILVILSGCLEPNMYVEVEPEEVNCTYSKINIMIDLAKPAEVTIFTSEGQIQLFVRERFEKSYLVENDKKTERVLVTSGEEEYQTVIKLPQCACLLVDVRTEWAEPTLTFLVTGIEDASVKLTANTQEKTLLVKKGEIKGVNFTMGLDSSSEIFGDVTATGRCEQTIRYSLDLKKSVVGGGKVSYLVGEYIQVEKQLQMDGLTEGFAMNVGERSTNFTLYTDGNPSQINLQGNTLVISEEFEKMELKYVIVPTIANGRYIFLDQVISQTPGAPVDVDVEFEQGYAPYYYDPYDLSFESSSPLKFTTQAKNYTKLVNLAYGPDQVRISLVLNASVIAHSNTSARLEILSPKNTNLQTIEKFVISEKEQSTSEIDGETYYVYEWSDLKEGDVRNLQIQVQAIRKAGLFPSLKEPFSSITQGSSYWQINSQMRQVANGLVGRNKYYSVYNVVNHVKDRIDYQEDQERTGAIAAYTSTKGACDEIFTGNGVRTPGTARSPRSLQN
jgi:hypothetical protein